MVSLSLFALILSPLIYSDARAGGYAAVVLAQGQTETIQVRGRDGSAGSDGSSGSDASCFRDDPAQSGGDGGSGSNGGDGENGGDVLVHFSDYGALRKIFLDSGPGRGASGGRGGAGGSGCNGGSSGSRGSDGTNGSEGARGRVFLVESLSRLAPEQVSFQAEIGRMIQTSTQLLRHAWSRKTGAWNLLAPGSVVSNDYSLFSGNIAKSVRVSWDATQELASVSSEPMILRLTECGKVIPSFPQEAIVSFQVSESSGNVLIRITQYISDLFHTKVSVREGGWFKPDWIIVSEDSKLPAEVETHFSLSVREKHWSGWYWVTLATVPIEEKYVQTSSTEEQINLSDLLSEQLSEYRTLFRTRRLNLSITRKVQGREVTKEYLLDKGV